LRPWEWYSRASSRLIFFMHRSYCRPV